MKLELVKEVNEFDEKDEFPWDIMKKAFEKGFMNVRIPKKFGGRGQETDAVAGLRLRRLTHQIFKAWRPGDYSWRRRLFGDPPNHHTRCDDCGLDHIVPSTRTGRGRDW